MPKQPSGPPATEQPGGRSRSTRRATRIGVALLLVAVLAGVVVHRVMVNRDRDRGGAATAAAPTAPADTAELLSVTRVPANFADVCDDQKGWAFPQTVDTLPIVKHVNDPAWVAATEACPSAATTTGSPCPP